MNENLFCKIFVRSATSREDLARCVANQVRGKVDGSSIECDWGVIDVLKNDDADCSRAIGQDGFLYFPYLVETEPVQGFDRSKFVGGIAGLLSSFWASRFGAVAACDFEEELPRSGGYVPDDIAPDSRS